MFLCSRVHFDYLLFWQQQNCRNCRNKGARPKGFVFVISLLQSQFPKLPKILTAVTVLIR